MSLISKNGISLIIQSFKKLLSKKANRDEIVNSDWSQNDSSSNTYIKNRTHWEENKTITLVDNLTRNDYQNGNAPACNFVPGNLYDVIWNGTLYEGLTCRFDGEFNIIGDNTNPFYIDDDGGNNLYIESDSGGYFVVSIIEHYTEIHKIDKKFVDVDMGNMMTKRNPVGEGSFSMNRNPDSDIGDYSHAEGNNTTASGQYSHAEGNNTTASDNSSHAEGIITTASGASSHAEGNNTTASGHYSHAEGNNTTASGTSSHAEGYNTTASGKYSHAEGNNTTASTVYSHAEGNTTIASGESSHAEGKSTTASGKYSHAEGAYTEAIGNFSHAEGQSTEASGLFSHAEGWGTKAIGNHSHAEGNYTIAYNNCQHVQGEFNIIDNTGSNNTRGRYVHIIGNGTSDSNRSNAHTVDWSGNGWYQGDLYVGGTSQDDGDKLITAKNIFNTIYLNENGIIYKLYIKNGTLVTELDVAQTLIDFEYTEEENGTYTLTAWKQTLNGKPSTECIIPDWELINL